MIKQADPPDHAGYWKWRTALKELILQTADRGLAGMSFLAIALIVMAVLFFKSPIATAAAEAIRHHNGVPPLRDSMADESLAQVTEELAQLRDQFSELAERVDFTERALAEVRRRDALQNPRS
jgi:hypothetical protein